MHDPFSYLSPTGPASSEFKDRGSAFLGALAPAAAAEEALAHVESQRKRYRDATHHCWAYRTGWAESLQSRCSDAGEPSRTAGPPILAALEGRGVSDACLVVVRYFGGVKLGTGGLVRAYREAAGLALDAAVLEPRTLADDMELALPYGAQGALRHAAASLGVALSQGDSGERLVLRARVPRGSAQAFEGVLERLGERWKGGIAWKSR
jgi:uncharacterized YigZ family protein